MSKPDLRRYTAFSPEDFAMHPVWICCYGLDQEEAWANELDEITYRPWTDTKPYSRQSSAVEVVVRTTFRLADGTILSGFATPPHPAWGGRGRDLASTQPTIFLPDGTRASFWTGIPPTGEMKRRFYSALAKEAQSVFPIRFLIAGDWIDKQFEGIIEGFGSLGNSSREIVIDQ